MQTQLANPSDTDLTGTTDADNERITRLITAANRIGDTALTATAYLVYGPAAIGVEALHRLYVTHFGFAQDDLVRVNVPASGIPAVREEFTQHIARVAKLWAYDPSEYDIEIVAL